MENRRLQSAMEFLSTYGWAFLILAALSLAIFYFVTLPTTEEPMQCVFQLNVYCKSLTITSNSIATTLNIILVNSQQYLILNPKVKVNMGTYGNSNTICSPTSDAAGNTIICVVIFNTAISPGATIGGTIHMNFTVCPSGIASNCQPPLLENYTGNFTERVAPGP